MIPASPVGALLSLLRRVPAEVWALILMSAAIIAWSWWCYDTGADRARAKAAAAAAELRAENDALRSANVDALALIGRVTEVNRELAEGREADQEAAAIAVAELRSERDALAKELERRRTDRGVIYERDESAAAWARARVPDLVARSLRE